MLVKQMPLEVRPLCKSDMRTQFAALCHRRRAGRTEVLLVTSRGTGRWIAPKGWPVAGLTPAETALQEAWEEAGVRGRVEDLCLGLYSYVKIVEDGPDLPITNHRYAPEERSASGNGLRAGFHPMST